MNLQQLIQLGIPESEAESFVDILEKTKDKANEEKWKAILKQFDFEKHSFSL